MQFKSLAVCALSLSLASVPLSASAHGHHDGLFVGLVAGTVAVAAAIITAPFVAINQVAQPAYYAPPPQPVYYAPAPAPQVYYAPPAPVYYAPPPPPPAYYAPAPYYR